MSTPHTETTGENTRWPARAAAESTRRAADGPTLTERIVAAAVEAIAERGVARTSLDDVARRAGCGRATIYRTFAGGKDEVVATVARTELRRTLDDVAGAMAGATTFEDAVAVALGRGYAAVAGHPALRRVLAGEPELLLPQLSFQGLDRVLDDVGAATGPVLGRFVDPVTARAVGEWIARVVVGRAAELAGAGMAPTAPAAPDLSDPATVQRFVATYLLPGVTATAGPPDSPLLPDAATSPPEPTTSPPEPTTPCRTDEE